MKYLNYVLPIFHRFLSKRFSVDSKLEMKYLDCVLPILQQLDSLDVLELNWHHSSITESYFVFKLKETNFILRLMPLIAPGCGRRPIIDWAKSPDWNPISFQEVFESCPDNIKCKLLYHLDTFKKYEN